MASPFSRLAAVALVVLAFSSGEIALPQTTGDPCILAPRLRDALQQRFGSSRVLTAADLYEDERSLFNADHRGGCPGVANGRFFGPKERPAIALVLLDVEPGKSVRLVVARPAMSTWTFLELDQMAEGSTAVVGVKGPGVYTDRAAPKTQRSTSDVVALTGYESWQRVYLWNGRNFERLQTSD
jgi:hypothetical protein